MHHHLLSGYILLSLCVSPSIGQNEAFDFQTCTGANMGLDMEHTVAGAILWSQSGMEYSHVKHKCSMTFKVPDDRSYFLTQLTHLDIGDEDCLYISAYDVFNETYVLKHTFCGKHSNSSNGKIVLAVKSPKLKVTWAVSSKASTSTNRGFKIILTAISSSKGLCNAQTHERCINNDCISSTLKCDGFEHCSDGSDEMACPGYPKFASQLRTKINCSATGCASVGPPDGSTDAPPATSNSPAAQPAYLWLPLIVVVLFTAIMITLIVVGRKRGADHSPEPTGVQINSSQVDGETDASGNRPSTPPPSYSVVERQFSYSSHVSQQSNEVSEPPDYIDAVHLPKTNSTRRTTQAPLSRQSTNRHIPLRSSFLQSLRGRGRFQLFSRSRSSHDSSIRRHPSDATDSIDGQRMSNLSDVFVDVDVSGDDSATHPASSSNPPFFPSRSKPLEPLYKRSASADTCITGVGAATSWGQSSSVKNTSHTALLYSDQPHAEDAKARSPLMNTKAV